MGEEKQKEKRAALEDPKIISAARKVVDQATSDAVEKGAAMQAGHPAVVIGESLVDSSVQDVKQDAADDDLLEQQEEEKTLSRDGGDVDLERKKEKMTETQTSGIEEPQ